LCKDLTGEVLLLHVLSAASLAYNASDLRSGQIKKINKKKEDKKRPSKPASSVFYRPVCKEIVEEVSVPIKVVTAKRDVNVSVVTTTITSPRYT